MQDFMLKQRLGANFAASKALLEREQAQLAALLTHHGEAPTPTPPSSPSRDIRPCPRVRPGLAITPCVGGGGGAAEAGV